VAGILHTTLARLFLERFALRPVNQGVAS
jgi:hypothetical protein